MPARKKPAKPGRILVVEDSPTQAELHRQVLEEAGFKLTLAKNAGEALQRLEEGPVDLVLTDIVMPDMSGYDLCRKIKAHEGWEHLPVMLLTTLTDPMEIVRGLEAGADNYITKPYEAKDLIRRVRQVTAERPRKKSDVQTEVRTQFLGQDFLIASRPKQVVEYLVSSFEDFIQLKQKEKEREVTEEKRRLELRQLAASQKFLQSALDALSAHIAILDADGRIIAVNAAWKRFAKANGFVGSRAAVGGNYLEICEKASDEIATEVATGIRGVIEEKAPTFYREYPCDSEKEKRWFFVRVTPFEGEGPARAVVAHENITERKLAEEALAQSRQGLAEAQRIAHLGNWDWNVVKNELKWSDEIYRIFGLTPQSFGATYEAFLETIHPDDRGFVKRSVQEALEDRKPYSIDHRIVLPDGSERVVHEQAEIWRDEAGEPERMIGTVQDITERKMAEAQQARLREEVEAARNRLETVLRQAPVGVTIHEAPSCRLLMSNDEARKLVGNPDLSAENLEEFSKFKGRRPDGTEYSGEDWPLARAVLKGETVVAEEVDFERADGVRVYLMVSATPIRDLDGRITSGVAVFNDVTQTKRLEEQFRQAQKMEAIGRLAGGVAHDFNNLLTAITGYSQLILMKLSEEDPMREEVNEIMQAGERAAALTRQLLAFSRKQILRPKVINLNEAIENLEKMLRRLIQEDVELATILAPSLSPIKADPGQIEQVLMNLVVNARDSMSEGGRITVQTGNVEVKEEKPNPGRDLAPGCYVLLTVSDNGSGIDPAILPQIFEPFFTTKGESKGTGLGLSTVYGIVKQSGGDILVESRQGWGTTFRVYLPAVGGLPEAGDAAGVKPKTARGSERVLLVEDEDGVRKLTRTLLQQSGYTVFEATNGEEALKLCEQADPVDLLITDVVMPGMGGQKLADALVEKWPGLKVIFLSGYTNSGVLRRGVRDKKMVMIQKPFRPEALSRRIREVLDEGRSG